MLGQTAIDTVTPPGGRGADRSQSRTASRAFDILEYFGRVQRPVRAIEIVRALDLHPSTVNQLLKTLVGSAHLAFDASSKTYLPSPRLAGFGAWMVASYGQDRFRRLLEDVRTSTDAGIVTLCTPNDLQIQVLDRISSNSWDGIAVAGTQVALFGSVAIGSAYLSALPNREVQRLSTRARQPKQNLPALLQTISRVRQEGVAEGISPEGRIGALAIPLPPCSPVPLILGFADDAQRVRRDRVAIRSRMREAISRLS